MSWDDWDRFCDSASNFAGGALALILGGAAVVGVLKALKTVWVWL